MTENSDITLDTQAPDQEVSQEQPVEETEAPKDPNVVGQVNEETARKIQAYRAQAAEALHAVGRLAVRLESMERETESVRREKNEAIDHLVRIENEAQGALNEIGDSFGIKRGEPWQFQPDGTIRKLDPALLQAARAREEQQPPQ